MESLIENTKFKLQGCFIIIKLILCNLRFCENQQLLHNYHLIGGYIYKL